MKRLLLAIVLFAAVGCGAPLCNDPSLRSSFVNGCTGNGASASYCGCAFEYLADRYTCQDMGNVTVNVVRDACRACGGGCP